MANSNDEIVDAQVEVIPPRKEMPHLTNVDYGPIRIALTRRMRLWSAAKVARGYETVFRHEALALQAAEERNKAHVDYDKSLVLLSESDNIVDAERQKIRADIEAQGLRSKIELEELRADLEAKSYARERAEAERDINDLIRELGKVLKPQTKKRSKLGEELDDIKERGKYIAELDELRDLLFKEAGVEKEEDLDDIRAGILRSAREAVELGVE